MEDKQPTQEQITEFWKWCGFHEEYFEDEPKTVWAIFYPDGKMVTEGLPTINLLSLFDYAIPTLKDKGWMARVQYSPLFDNDTGIKVSDWTGYASIYHVLHDKPLSNKFEYSCIHKEPALALFWAIWELIQEK